MKFGSVCSGIEAASVAWEPLGWKAAWFAEVDRAASEVLAYRFPDVPNHGDMTKLAAMVRARRIPAPDVLVGGTPCQSFSIAGLRGGLGDARGQLTLAFVDLANAIDEIRIADGLEPVIVVWENVPGVLTHNDNPLGCLLAGLAGDDEALEPGPRPDDGRSAAYWTWDKKAGEHRPKWPVAGAVAGPERAVAWRVLDAQWFGLAQRRRRVFVVASARARFDPAAILLEFEGVRRDSAPRREAGEGFTHATAPCLTSSGRGVERAGDTRGQDPVVAVIDDGGHLHGFAGVEPVPTWWDGRDVSQTLDAVLHKGQTMPEKNRFPAVLQPIAFDTTQITSPGNYSSPRAGDPCHPLAAGAHPPAVCVTGSVTHTLKADGFDASEDGTGRGQPIVPATGFQASQSGVRINDTVGTLDANYGSRRHNGVFTGMAVRRLMPVECERLQGFPDNWTLVPTGKSCKPAADGPRYKQCGNSMATPVMHWIGRRIDNAVKLIGHNGAPDEECRYCGDTGWFYGDPDFGPCSMGVGCDEYGMCYAEAHGEPQQCPLADQSCRYCNDTGWFYGDPELGPCGCPATSIAQDLLG